MKPELSQNVVKIGFKWDCIAAKIETKMDRKCQRK